MPLRMVQGRGRSSSTLSAENKATVDTARAEATRLQRLTQRRGVDNAAAIKVQRQIERDAFGEVDGAINRDVDVAIEAINRLAVTAHAGVAVERDSQNKMHIARSLNQSRPIPTTGGVTKLKIFG